jgi:hypothetical protein
VRSRLRLPSVATDIESVIWALFGLLFRQSGHDTP